MHKSITGIDIHEDRLIAVQVRGGMNRYAITACTQIPLKERDLGEGLERLSQSIDLATGKCVVSIPPHRISFRNLDLPFTDARKIRQTLPYELETLLPFPVEDLIIDFIKAAPDRTGEILSASVNREMVSTYLNILKDHGMNPDHLDVRGLSIVPWLWKQANIPERFVLLELGEKRSTLFLCINRHVALIRTLTVTKDAAAGKKSPARPARDEPLKTGDEAIQPLGVSIGRQVRQTLHAYQTGHEQPYHPEKVFLSASAADDPETDRLLGHALDLPVERIDISRDQRVSKPAAVLEDWDPGAMNSALAAALRDPRTGAGLDFRKNEFEKKGRYPEAKRAIRKGAIFLVLILALLGGHLITDYYMLKREYNRLDTEVVRLFKKTLPQVTRIVDPVQQLKVEIQQLEKESASTAMTGSDRRVLDLLADLSRRIPKTVDVHVSRMVMDPKSVRIGGETDTFNSVDSLKNALTPSAFFSEVTISSANLDRKNNRVKFEMKLKRNRGQALPKRVGPSAG